jgi:hypothetical protein
MTGLGGTLPPMNISMTRKVIVKRTIALLVLACGCVGWIDGATAAEPPAAAEHKQPNYWMKKKLEYSQQILTGLAHEDFTQIRQTAEAMNALSQIENWVHASRPDYRTQLSIFRDANQQLIAEAEAKDIDGAALANVQLTLSCVNCHKIVRDAKSTKAKP